MKKVEILGRRRLLDDFLKVDEVVLRHERLDRTLSPPLRRLSLERGDGVAALLYKPRQQRVVLVRQFRYPAHTHGDGWLLEVVAGMVGQDESPAATIRREIAEETGYQVATLQLTATFYLSPGGSSERIFLYYGEVDDDTPRHPGGGLVEEHEDIEVVEMELAEVWQALDTGEIADAKTLVALMGLRQRLSTA
jgi:ADP-ribose pyrophosphatase